jgi:hypothetical protein
MSGDELQILRQSLESASATDAERLVALFDLAEHPEAQFSDLISAPRFPVPTASNAAYILHQRLGVPCVDGRAILEPEYWVNVLQHRAIDPEAPYRSARAGM